MIRGGTKTVDGEFVPDVTRIILDSHCCGGTGESEVLEDYKPLRSINLNQKEYMSDKTLEDLTEQVHSNILRILKPRATDKGIRDHANWHDWGHLTTTGVPMTGVSRLTLSQLTNLKNLQLSETNVIKDGV